MTEQEQKLHEAIASLLHKEQKSIQCASIATVIGRIVGLIAGRWEHLCDLALEEGNDGHVAFTMGVKMSVGEKCPTGTVKLAFNQRTEDECSFAVEDPEQETLPFASVLGREVVPPPGVTNPPRVISSRTRRNSATRPAATATTV